MKRDTSYSHNRQRTREPRETAEQEALRRGVSVRTVFRDRARAKAAIKAELVRGGAASDIVTEMAHTDDARELIRLQSERIASLEASLGSQDRELAWLRETVDRLIAVLERFSLPGPQCG